MPRLAKLVGMTAEIPSPAPEKLHGSGAGGQSLRLCAPAQPTPTRGSQRPRRTTAGVRAPPRGRSWTRHAPELTFLPVGTDADYRYRLRPMLESKDEKAHALP